MQLRALGPLVGYLRGLGVIPKLAASADSPVDRLLVEYRHYLLREGGLTAGSVAHLERELAILLLLARENDGLHWPRRDGGNSS